MIFNFTHFKRIAEEKRVAEEKERITLEIKEKETNEIKENEPEPVQQQPVQQQPVQQRMMPPMYSRFNAGRSFQMNFGMRN